MTGTHPKEYLGCEGCGSLRDDTDWQTKRRLPQVGQTYECPDCGYEVYVYDATEPPNRGQNKQWRPVTDSMATNLLFFVEVGDYPDSALEDLFAQGLERYEGIDYHMTEVEGLSQTEWADRRGASQQAVSENVSKAREKLAE